MGHSMGISDSYCRPIENEFFEDYLKAAPLLTITDTISFYKKQVFELKEKKQRLRVYHKIKIAKKGPYC